MARGLGRHSSGVRDSLSSRTHIQWSCSLMTCLERLCWCLRHAASIPLGTDSACTGHPFSFICASCVTQRLSHCEHCGNAIPTEQKTVEVLSQSEYFHRVVDQTWVDFSRCSPVNSGHCFMSTWSPAVGCSVTASLEEYRSAD